MKRISILLLICCTCFGLAAWPQAQPQWWHHKIITFDAPGAGTGSNQGTWPASMDSAMDIVGTYFDSNGAYHGFLRYPDGKFAPPIDDPNAGTGSGQGTSVNNILDSRGIWIIGNYSDSNGVGHGFLLDPKGNFTEIDDPDAGTGAGQGTNSEAINQAGEIAGNFTDSNGAWHDFLLDRNGNFTNWDCLQAGTGSSQGTVNWMWLLTPKGEVQAECADSSNVWHGSIRYPNGKIIDFDAKDAGRGTYQGTFPFSINSQGWISGVYIDAQNNTHGFVRDPWGKITEFDAKKGIQYTDPWSINSEGYAAGMYCDAQGNCQHGFVRAPDGTITTYYVPGAGKGPALGLWTVNMSEEGAITGNYEDANGVWHGFLRLP